MKELYFYFNKFPQAFLTLAFCCIFQANMHAQLSTDVGVIAIHSPISKCGLGNETVEVTLQNFGLNPQALIPFNFTVNGVSANVSQPTDGVYTGVLGTDSIVTVAFETTFDFSNGGTYTIAAFTELPGDMDLSNDTSYYTVENISTIDNFPHFNNFESSVNGWSVDTDPNSSDPTWAFGTPTTVDIQGAASGANAWVTSLDGNYNNGELSYLVSPCMDFTNMATDPSISFSLFHETELSFDGLWLEGTIDNGDTWTKLGAMGQGLNWYNFDNTNQTLGEVWAGNSDGWMYAKLELTGYANQSECRFRFGFDSDDSVNFEGIGIDDIYIFNPVTADLGVATANHTDASICGSEMDSIIIDIRNYGTTAQTGFDVSYQIDNGPIVTENVGALVVNPDESVAYTFTEPFNSNVFNTVLEITTWSSLDGELSPVNDTTFYNLITTTPAPLPIAEDFEAAVIPTGWTADGIVGDGHNNVSLVIYDNMYSGDPSFEVTSPILGPINAGDSLTFDYRYTEWSAGTTALNLGDGDELNVQISTDCGETFTTLFTIDQNNHTPSVVMTNLLVDLDAYAGEYIIIRFFATWGTSDYWLDLDNINIIGCPIDLGLTTALSDESTPGSMDGSITVTPSGGAGPYDYSWDNGMTTSTITNLEQGDYVVTVVDANGCMDVITASIGVMVSAKDLQILRDIIVAPNPTSGTTFLNLSFNKPIELKVEVLNVVGQTVFAAQAANTTEQSYEVDLTNYSSGIYFIRLSINNETHIEKLIRM